MKIIIDQLELHMGQPIESYTQQNFISNSSIAP